MIEAVTKIKKAEAEADELRKQASALAKDIEAAAHAEGRQMLESAKRDCAAKAAAMLAEAKEKADGITRASAAQAKEESEALVSGARGNLDAAAKLIVERIVEAV